MNNFEPRVIDVDYEVSEFRCFSPGVVAGNAPVTFRLPTATCRYCGGGFQLGTATVDTCIVNVGAGAYEFTSMPQAARRVPVWKCVGCGHSVTA